MASQSLNLSEQFFDQRKARKDTKRDFIFVSFAPFVDENTSVSSGTKGSGKCPGAKRRDMCLNPGLAAVDPGCGGGRDMPLGITVHSPLSRQSPWGCRDGGAATPAPSHPMPYALPYSADVFLLRHPLSDGYGNT